MKCLNHKNKYENSESTASAESALPQSPECLHKDPRVVCSQLPVFTSIAQTRVLAVNLGEVASQPAGFESFSDVGSSNANRPASASMDLEEK